VLSLWAALGGLAIGLALGLLGGGGSTLTVPLLLALGVEPKAAIALSLAVVATTAGVAVVSHARAKSVDWRAAAWLLPGVALGGFAGGRAAGLFSGRALLSGFAVLMALAGIAMLLPRPATGSAPGPRPLAVAGAGVAIGAITGLVGAGGGFLFVPVLALVGGLEMRRAVGTSLVAIAVNALAALAGQLEHVELPLALAAVLTSAGVVGALLGARLVPRVPERALRRAFGVLVLITAAWLVARLA
jgi:uncharacterized membrane protein YfcA